IFHRGRPPRPSHGHTGLVVLRLVSALMAVVTAVVVARLVAEATGDRVIGLFTGAGLGLVPQWCAVMGGVSTDPPATLLAALAVAAIARLTSEERGLGAPLLVGLLVGAAWAIKATTAFLVPMALLACLARTPWRWPDRTRQMTALMVGLLLSAGWIPLRGWILFGDPQASAFKKALLEAGGFVPVAGPMPWTADFWLQLRPMVFESFWARFGSLGAGPFPGARVWTIYAAGSALLALLATLGTARAITARPLLRPRLPMLCALGTVFGVAAWVFVNLVPRADMVVHWTPRHVLPLTAPVAVLIGLGATRLRQVVPSGERVVGVALGMLVVALALANLAALRATVLMFHFGY
nr:glycosyltransferase family 39 protein [Acidobacteriota bacterium]